MLFPMKIAELLVSWRHHKEIGVREAAKQIGLKPATLNRVERGEGMDGSTLARLLRWLLTE